MRAVKYGAALIHTIIAHTRNCTTHSHYCHRSEANFTRAHQLWPERWLIAEGDAPLQPLEVASTEPTTAPFSGSSSGSSSGSGSSSASGSGAGGSGAAANKFVHEASASMPFGRGPAACPAQSLATVQLKVSIHI
jgi:cytochrome P450